MERKVTTTVDDHEQPSPYEALKRISQFPEVFNHSSFDRTLLWLKDIAHPYFHPHRLMAQDQQHNAELIGRPLKSTIKTALAAQNNRPSPLRSPSVQRFSRQAQVRLPLSGKGFSHHSWSSSVKSNLYKRVGPSARDLSDD